MNVHVYKCRLNNYLNFLTSYINGIHCLIRLLPGLLNWHRDIYRPSANEVTMTYMGKIDISQTIKSTAKLESVFYFLGNIVYRLQTAPI